MWCLSSFRREKPQNNPEISERFKYALNGVYTIENFSSFTNNCGYPHVGIGFLCEEEWYIQSRPVFNDPSIWAIIQHGHLPNEVNMKISAYFNFLNIKRSIKLENEEHTTLGLVFSNTIAVEDLLDEKNGWLIDDKVSIEYGIHVHAIQRFNEEWKFHFEGEPFNCKKKNMIRLRYLETDDSKFFGFNKTFLSYHTSYFDGSPDGEFFIQDGMYRKLVNECFQIAHGIRIIVSDASDFLPLMKIASHYKLSNVVKYLERLLFQRHVSSKNIPFWTRISIQFDLNHLLSLLMRRYDSLEILGVFRTESPEMSGRIMKMFIARYLYNKV